MLNAENSTNQSFKIVANMNTAFGNAAGVRTAPDFTRVRKQVMNIQDEIKELKTAIDNRDLTEIRDALCDICVFAYGAHHMLGIAGFELRHLNAPRNYEDFLVMIVQMEIRFKNICDMFDLSTPTSESLAFYLDDIVNYAASMQESLGVDHDADMQDVIDGVMTRFIKDDADKAATDAIWVTNKGLDVYYEGEYPTMIMKSAKDQPDAPKGKFLKSASYRNTIFRKPNHYACVIYFPEIAQGHSA